MLLREPRWRNAAKAAVGPDLVVVLPPDSDRGTSLMQRLEPVLVQAFVAELAVEALDVAVLHWPSRLDQNVPNAVCLRPRHESPTGELGAVVGANGHWIAAEPRRLVQHSGHVF